MFSNLIFNQLFAGEWKLNVTAYQTIDLMSRVFTNDLGNQGSIQGWVIQKTQKMVRDTTLLSTQHYKVRIKGKVEQSKEWSSALSHTLV